MDLAQEDKEGYGSDGEPNIEEPLLDRYFSALQGPQYHGTDMAEEHKLNKEVKKELNEEIYNSISKFSEIKTKYSNQGDTFEKEKLKIISKIKDKKNELENKLNTSGSRRTFDKVTFMLSLAIIQYKSYALGRYADNEAYWLNLVLLVLLYLWRNITYRMTGEHYYMLEFCYYGNVITYVFIFLYPENRHLYYASFAFANGPIGWALALVGCKFVLHSIDSLTSVFIHYTPMFLMWNLHWKTQYSKTRTWALYDAKQDVFSFEFIKNYYFAAITTYLLWSVVYYLIVFVFAKSRIENRKYMTLMKYYDERGGKESKLFNSMGKPYAGLIYLASHFLVSFTTMTISIICFFLILFSLSPCCIFIFYLLLEWCMLLYELLLKEI